MLFSHNAEHFTSFFKNVGILNSSDNILGKFIVFPHLVTINSIEDSGVITYSQKAATE